MYISGRPEYRASDPMDPHELVDRLRIASGAPPFFLKRSTLAKLSALDKLALKLVDVEVPQIPWTGETPTVLVFQRAPSFLDSLCFTLELGCCSHTASVDDEQVR